MSTIHANANGTIARFLRTPEEEARYPTPPAGGSALSFDAAANATLIAALDGAWNSVRLSGGVVTVNGTAQTIAADGPDEAARKAAQAMITVLRGGTATTQQRDNAIAWLLRRELMRGG